MGGQSYISGALLDDTNGAQVVEPPEMHATHDGKAFRFNNKFAAVASAASALVLLKPGAVPIHLRMVDVECTAAPLDITLSEAPTQSALGTPYTLVGANRTSQNAAQCQCWTGPTVSNDGTNIDGALVTGSKQDGGFGRNGEREYVLQPGTLYLVRVKNNSGGNSDIMVRLFLLEPATGVD